jgi:hypothetical protein
MSLLKLDASNRVRFSMALLVVSATSGAFVISDIQIIDISA